MVHFKRFRLGKEAAILVLNCKWHCYQLSYATTRDILYCAVLYCANTVRARFSMLQLGMIPIYTGKSKYTIPYRTELYHAQLLV